MQNTSSYPVICALKSILARHGVPDVLVSDNGPQYASQAFKQFTKDWDFVHVTSSPYFPQSNGQSESAVKVTKGLLMKAIDSGQDWYKSLLSYRNSPLQDGKSPSELLMGRRLKDSLPSNPSLLKTEISPGHSANIYQHKVNQKEHFDKMTKDLPELKSGEQVKLRAPGTSQWAQNATVLRQTAPRSYEVETSNGSELRRNRRDLLKAPSQTPEGNRGAGSPGTSGIENSGTPRRREPAIPTATQRRSTRQIRAPRRLLEELG